MKTAVIGLLALLSLYSAAPYEGGCLDTAERLRSRWLDLGRRLDTPPDSTELFSTFDGLVERYCESHRAYHTLAHVEHALEELSGARGEAADPEAVELALWFHDVVYDLGSRSNEEESAELARAAAERLGLDAARAGRVAELILATRHDAAPVDGDARLVVDVDLSILGQSRERFDTYEEEIRREYAPVIEERGAVAFNRGRAGILERFLERPAIYSTELFRARYEDQARANLRHSIRRLRESAWTEAEGDGQNRGDS